ncbi:hypothetical protein M9Y10_016491 [Tritrichomonas musculus]|uniref:Protein kinase domain-containing protein n=1 Tax=Tritrichomonas musculus TaxID=1915356 RepID=A0ABR2HX57_9EUKA
MENKRKRREKKRIIGNYELLELLGTGSFSSVWLAKHKITNYNVAIKIVNHRTLLSAESKMRFNKELSLLKQLHHPFIAELFEIIEDNDAIYVVMENVERGNLLDYINSQGTLDEHKARRYFSQLMSALDYLHNKKFIVHRDLKAENILIDKYDNIRLIDFGFSSEFSKFKPELTTACGSPAYAAPEMIQGYPYTKSADIWSAGVVLYAMVAGVLPFDDENTQTILQKIVYTDVVYPPTMSRSLIDLLKRLLIKNPSKRLSISQISQHPWLIQGDYSPIIDFNFNINYNEDSSNNANSNGNNINEHENNSFAAQSISSNAIKNSNFIDKSIIEHMRASGFDVSSLVQLLLLDDFSKPVTTVYRILVKNKTTETTHAIMEALSKKSNWRDSNTLSVSFPVQNFSGNSNFQSSTISEFNSAPGFAFDLNSSPNLESGSSSTSNLDIHQQQPSNFTFNSNSPFKFGFNSNTTTNFAFSSQLTSTSDSYSNIPGNINLSLPLSSSNSTSANPTNNNSIINNSQQQNLANIRQNLNMPTNQPPQQIYNSFDIFPSQHPQQPPQVLQLISQTSFTLPKKTRMSLQTYLPPPSLQYPSLNNNNNNNNNNHNNNNNLNNDNQLHMQPMQVHLQIQPNQVKETDQTNIPNFPNSFLLRRRRMSRPLP